MKYLTATVVLALTTFDAWSAVPTHVPEPGILPLVAIGAVGGLVIWVRNRRKK